MKELKMRFYKDFDPTCINPMSVAEKIDKETGESKLRLCMDCSRHVNTFIKREAVQLDTLDRTQSQLEENAFMISFDLEHMYHQIKLSKDMYEFFAFEWEGVVYISLVMMFGVNVGVEEGTRLFKPIKGFVQDFGLIF